MAEENYGAQNIQVLEGLGLRSYHGNCPYGQFRNLRSFSHIGLCLMLE